MHIHAMAVTHYTSIVMNSLLVDAEQLSNFSLELLVQCSDINL